MPDSCLIRLDYETRNLGIACYAVTPEYLENPDEASLLASLAAKQAADGSFFIQAKISKEQIPATGILERHGFSFIETALVPTTIIAKNSVLASFNATPELFIPKRYDAAALSLQPLDKEDSALCAIVRAIASESFTTDRFHKDPHCSSATADRRYLNWTNDLLQNETNFDLLLHKETVTGFMAHKEGHLILAGFARSYVASGLGDFLWLSVLAKLQTKGITQIHTQISTNNLPVLNLYARLGFKFKEAFTLLHYWHRFNH